MQPLQGLLNKTTHQLYVTDSSITCTTILQKRWSSQVMQHQHTILGVQNGRLIDAPSLEEYLQITKVRVIDILFDKKLLNVIHDTQPALYWCMLESDAIIDGRVLFQYILLMNSLDIEIRSIAITNAK